MARKGRHSSRTGDGGAELRLQKQRAAAAEREQKEAELAFYDDPSGGEDASEDVDSDGSDFDGAEGALELGDGADDDEDEDDDEDDEEDEDDEMEDFAGEKKRIEQMGDQWGKSKKNFYSADTAEFELDSDEEAAKDEEDAALELQRKQADMMDEEDFGFGADAPDGDNEDNEDNEDDEETAALMDDEDLVGAQLADLSTLADSGSSAVERVPRDFSKLSKTDKLEIVNQSAPELLGLVSELETALRELREVLTPALTRLQKVQHTMKAYNAGVQFLVTKQSLVLNYVTNISFYLLLRAEGKSVADHPVLQHLLAVKKQLLRLEATERVLAPQLQDLLTKDFPVPTPADDGMAQFFSSSTKTKPQKSGAKNQKPEKNLNATNDKQPKIKKAAAEDATAAEKARATAFYAAALAEKALLQQSKQALYMHAKPALEASDDDASDDDAEGKRGASYEIIKNKGLKAHKSKLNRNPRVKKRMQFRKAVIRRKGQVRDVRVGEASKYGGETTGIKANLTRSRKIRN